MFIAHRQSGSIVEAEREFRAARYDNALELLEGCEDWQAPDNEAAVAVRAEIITRRDPLAALQELANAQDLFQTPEGLFNYYLLIGRAYSLTRNFDAADAMFRKARKMIKGGEADWLPRVALHTSKMHWLMGEYDPESLDVIHSLQSALPLTRVQALVNRAWMYSGLEQYERQIADFCSALKIVEEVPSLDVYVVACMIHGLLRVALETGDERAVAVAKSAFERLAWTPDVRVEHFQSQRVLGWHAFLNGEPIRAQRYFKETLSLAPSDAWRVTAHLDRAFVAAINSNELWSMEETFEAERIARAVPWASTRGEERIALGTLAVMLSKIDMAKAQAYVALYNQLGTSSIAPNLALNRDRRPIAAERYASGRVQLAMGNPELAETLLVEAFTIFGELRHHYRAALAAMALFEATGDSAWQQRFAEHGKAHPRSPVSVALERAGGEPDDEIYRSLTPSQRQVFAAICEGLSVAEMAERFNRSVFTINKHIQAVYNAYDVHSRNELRAEAKRRGLFGRISSGSLDVPVKLVKS